MCRNGKSQNYPKGILVTIYGSRQPFVGTERLWNVAIFRNQERMSWAYMVKQLLRPCGQVMVYLS